MWTIRIINSKIKLYFRRFDHGDARSRVDVHLRLLVLAVREVLLEYVPLDLLLPRRSCDRVLLQYVDRLPALQKTLVVARLEEAVEKLKVGFVEHRLFKSSERFDVSVGMYKVVKKSELKLLRKIILWKIIIKLFYTLLEIISF